MGDDTIMRPGQRALELPLELQVKRLMGIIWCAARQRGGALFITEAEFSQITQGATLEEQVVTHQMTHEQALQITAHTSSIILPRDKRIDILR